MIENRAPQGVPVEQATPDFADDAEPERHAALLAAGYWWWSHDHSTVPGSKTLYQKRCREHEAEEATGDGEAADRCFLNLWRYDMRPYRRVGTDARIAYQAELRFEATGGIAVKVDLSGIAPESLITALPTLERLMLDMWDAHARKVNGQKR